MIESRLSDPGLLVGYLFFLHIRVEFDALNTIMNEGAVGNGTINNCGTRAEVTHRTHQTPSDVVTPFLIFWCQIQISIESVYIYYRPTYIQW